MSEERKKPPFVPGMFDMRHVPEPNPENFWNLELDDPRVVMVEPGTNEPLLTLVVRRIDGNKVDMQIVASPKMRTWKPQ